MSADYARHDADEAAKMALRAEADGSLARMNGGLGGSVHGAALVFYAGLVGGRPISPEEVRDVAKAVRRGRDAASEVQEEARGEPCQFCGYRGGGWDLIGPWHAASCILWEPPEEAWTA
jgi:hypothetical protein